MLVRELGRGVHGKVKLGKDMETGEWVVSISFDLIQKYRRKNYTVVTNLLFNVEK